MRAAMPGQRSWGGSMPFGRRPTASCSSRSFIAPASPVAGAGRETAALSRCLLLYPRARRSRRARSLRCRRARTPPAPHRATPQSRARDRCSDGGAQHAAPLHLNIDLERAIAELPDGAREVFVLFDIEGYGHGEIAALVGIAEGTSKAQLFRARRLLREKLER